MFLPPLKDKDPVHSVWLVGGSVRDYLLGIAHVDLDYAVEADSFEHMEQ